MFLSVRVNTQHFLKGTHPVLAEVLCQHVSFQLLSSIFFFPPHYLYNLFFPLQLVTSKCKQEEISFSIISEWPQTHSNGTTIGTYPHFNSEFVGIDSLNAANQYCSIFNLMQYFQFFRHKDVFSQLLFQAALLTSQNLVTFNVSPVSKLLFTLLQFLFTYFVLNKSRSVTTLFTVTFQILRILGTEVDSTSGISRFHFKDFSWIHFWQIHFLDFSVPVCV